MTIERNHETFLYQESYFFCSLKDSQKTQLYKSYNKCTLIWIIFEKYISRTSYILINGIFSASIQDKYHKFLVIIPLTNESLFYNYMARPSVGNNFVFSIKTMKKVLYCVFSNLISITYFVFCLSLNIIFMQILLFICTR